MIDCVYHIVNINFAVFVNIFSATFFYLLKTITILFNGYEY